MIIFLFYENFEKIISSNQFVNWNQWFKQIYLQYLGTFSVSYNSVHHYYGNQFRAYMFKNTCNK